MKLGVLGGSGLYELDGMTNVEHVDISTPFGAPSDSYVRGELAGNEVVFLPRHGVGHRIMPSEINHRANIYGFKMMEIEAILSVSAVGSLREEMRPRDIVLPDQYFDRTKQSHTHTFFGEGAVAHVTFGEPACPELRAAVAAVAREVTAGEDIRVTEGGTYVCMEGPAFSTKAESNTYRKLGFDIIGMTGLPEAKLCREAEICYQGLSMVTDYDCWHETEEHVSVERLLGHLRANTERAKKILEALIPRLSRERTCACGSALSTALVTQKAFIPESIRHKLGLLLGE